MRRILAQTRKELTQLVRRQDGSRSRACAALHATHPNGVGNLTDGRRSSIAVQDLDDSPTSRTLIDAFRHSNTFRIVPFAVDRQPETAFHVQPRPRGLDYPSPFRPRHCARRDFARANADRRVGFQYRQTGVGLRRRR